jgi:acid phosphatase (class A)
MIGTLTGMVLAELYPSRSAEVLARGMEFGESRVVCGFHYQSDVDAGRLAAAGLMARLQGEQSFRDAMDAVRTELRTPAK